MTEHTMMNICHNAWDTIIRGQAPVSEGGDRFWGALEGFKMLLV